MILVSGVQQNCYQLLSKIVIFDNSLLCSSQVYLPYVTIQHYYNTIDYNPYALPFIPVTFSFHKCKPVSPTALHPFSPSFSVLVLFLVETPSLSPFSPLFWWPCFPSLLRKQAIRRASSVSPFCMCAHRWRFLSCSMGALSVLLVKASSFVTLSLSFPASSFLFWILPFECTNAVHSLIWVRIYFQGSIFEACLNIGCDGEWLRISRVYLTDGQSASL